MDKWTNEQMNTSTNKQIDKWTSVGRISFFGTNEYSNIFITIDIGQMNIRIYSA